MQDHAVFGQSGKSWSSANWRPASHFFQRKRCPEWQGTCLDCKPCLYSSQLGQSRKPQFVLHAGTADWSVDGCTIVDSPRTSGECLDWILPLDDGHQWGMVQTWCWKCILASQLLGTCHMQESALSCWSFGTAGSPLWWKGTMDAFQMHGGLRWVSFWQNKGSISPELIDLGNVFMFWQFWQFGFR